MMTIITAALLDLAVELLRALVKRQIQNKEEKNSA